MSNSLDGLSEKRRVLLLPVPNTSVVCGVNF